MFITLLDGIRTAHFDERRVALQPLQELALFVLLLEERGLTKQALFECLWEDEDRPADSKQVVRIVSALRSALGSDRVITSKVGREVTYSVRPLADDIVDLDWFRRAVVWAKRRSAQEPGAAALMYRHALGSWVSLPQGAPRTDRMQALLAGLREERLGVQERYLEVRLRLGEHREMCQQLMTLVTEHPDRDRLLELLLMALYRSQRQAEALDWAERGLARKRAAGLTPPPDLLELRDWVADHSADLALPPIPVPEAERAVRRSGGDPTTVSPPRVSTLLATMAWPGHSSHVAQYFATPDRVALGFLELVAPEILTITFEAVDLAMLVVDRLVRRQGVRQFVEFGALPPSERAVHAVASEGSNSARVLYVNSDPHLVRFAQELVQDTPKVEFMHGTLPSFLREGTQTAPIDWTRPVCVLDQHNLSVFPDTDAYRHHLSRLGQQMTPGSYLFLSCASEVGMPEPVRFATQVMFGQVPEGMAPRDPDTIASLIPEDFELQPPGVVPTTDLWEMFSGTPSPHRGMTDRFPRFSGLAVKK
ncbi:SAM-dependent methyltransferase [Spirillospora sp. NPDC050679]